MKKEVIIGQENPVSLLPYAELVRLKEKHEQGEAIPFDIKEVKKHIDFRNHNVVKSQFHQ
jgi:hypothetical protein